MTKLSAVQRRSFERFLAERGTSEPLAQPIDKMLWLQSIVERGPIPATLLNRLVLSLREVGPQEPEERFHHNVLVRAFARELAKHQQVLPNPEAPSMPEDVFSTVLEMLETWEGRGTNFRAQTHTAMLIAWHTGLYGTPLRCLRKGQIESLPDGTKIRIKKRPPRKDSVFWIPRTGSFGEAAWADIRNWVSRDTTDPEAFLIPFVRVDGVLDWTKPMNAQTLTCWFRKSLTLAGVRHHYNVFSIRRAFLARSRDALGLLPTFTLSGNMNIRSTLKMLRGNPDWSQARNLFD